MLVGTSSSIVRRLSIHLFLKVIEYNIDKDNHVIISYVSECHQNHIKLIRLKISNDKISKRHDVIICQFKAIQYITTSRNYIAVSSKSGRKLLVFSINDLSVVYCYWRGRAKAIIKDLFFDEKETFLGCLSTHMTLHIFTLDNAKLENPDHTLLSFELAKPEESPLVTSFFDNIFVILSNSDSEWR